MSQGDGHYAVIHRTRRRPARAGIGIAGGKPGAAGIRQGDGEGEDFRGAGSLSGHALDHRQARGAVAVVKHDCVCRGAVPGIGDFGGQPVLPSRHRYLDKVFRRVVDVSKRVPCRLRHLIAVGARTYKADASEAERPRTGAQNADGSTRLSVRHGCVRILRRQDEGKAGPWRRGHIHALFSLNLYLRRHQGIDHIISHHLSGIAFDLFLGHGIGDFRSGPVPWHVFKRPFPAAFCRHGSFLNVRSVGQKVNVDAFRPFPIAVIGVIPDLFTCNGHGFRLVGVGENEACGSVAGNL